MAAADTVKSYEFTANKNGFACMVTMTGSEGGQLNIRISKEDTGWITMVSVSDRAEKFRGLYGPDGFLDETMADAHLSLLVMDTTMLRLDRLAVTAVVRQEVAADTGAILQIPDEEATKALVLASNGDFVAMPLMLAFDGASAALSEFRTCAMAAMGIEG